MNKYTQGITDNGVKWASQHDWFIKVSNVTTGLSATGYETELYEIEVRHDMGQGQTLKFDCFNALRAWAGY